MTEKSHHITLQQQLSEKFEITVSPSSPELFSKLLEAIVKDMILNNMNKLLYILYRVDVEEEKVLKIIQENTLPDAAHLISEALISRQLYKIQHRQGGNAPSDIPENEKW